MKKLYFIKPDLNLYENIAVIGSADALLERNDGEFIDSFDSVVRFNRAITKGFEKHVGSFTDLRVVNLHVLKCSLDIRDGVEQPGRDFIKELRDTKILVDCMPDVLIKNAQNLHSSNEIYHSNRWNQQHLLEYKIGHHMSLGTFLISVLVQSGFKPHCFGFGRRGDKKVLTSHYFWNKPKGKSVCHDFNLERQLLLQMEQDKKIVLHI